MDFRTTFTIPEFAKKIGYSQPIVSMGSCFSTVMGQQLQQRKFKVLNNPFGTIFNPQSMTTLLLTCLKKQRLDDELFLQHEGRFLHFSVHSSLSAQKKEDLKHIIQNQIDSTTQYLQQASHLILTFGTAFVHDLSASHKTVANCHKQPAGLFTKRLLSLEELKRQFTTLYHHLLIHNPSLQLILTVSPVRHTKDGIPENQLSKSLLRVFCQELVDTLDQVTYFPSYELMLDDLRDYRYYKEDMVHPTAQAEDYIWEKFAAAAIASEAHPIMEEIMTIRRALAHKPFNPHGKAHQAFLQNLLKKMERMEPDFDFSEERRQVLRGLSESAP